LPEVTVPEPVGVAQTPSPRQKVEEEASVPEFKFVTGRLPVTPVVNGRPVAFVSVTALGVPRFGVVRAGDDERTTAPVPVFEVAASPLIEKLFPVPAVSYVLFVRVSVDVRETRLSVSAGSVSVVVPAIGVATIVVEPEVAPRKAAPALEIVGVVRVAPEARTTAPLPVLAVTATPFMEKLFPVPAVS
jgi:hypothetical protein